MPTKINRALPPIHLACKHAHKQGSISIHKQAKQVLI